MFQLAFLNIVRQWRRYNLLLITVALGFGVLLIILGITSGLQQAVKDKAALYFSGHVTVSGFRPDGRRVLENQDAIMKSLNEMKGRVKGLARRSIYYDSNATLANVGETVVQRRVLGIDWEVEGDNFSIMDFVEGTYKTMGTGDGILISSLAANKLGLRVGDEVNLLITTITGQQNSLFLKVQGVFSESSLFAYSSYIDIETMNSIIGLPPGSATDAGVFLKAGSSTETSMDFLINALQGSLKVYPPIANKEALNEALAVPRTEVWYAILSLRTHLSQIQEMIDAIFFVTWVLLVVFIAVIMIGVSNTYRMIIRERTKELGTMRALGMQRRNVIQVFLGESVIVATLGAGLGGLIGLIILLLIGSLKWSYPDSLVAMFLRDGHVAWLVELPLIFGSFAILVASSVLGAFGPALSAAKIQPVEALRAD